MLKPSNMKARGLRNNNPANIRRGSSWLGLSKNQNDKLFCQFESISYGIRAFLVLMRTYHYKYKLNTIAKILHRFAPLSENNTYYYIAFVEKYMYEHQVIYSLNGVECQKIRFTDDFNVNIWFNKTEPSYNLILFTLAVLKMETGEDFSVDDIDKAIALL